MSKGKLEKFEENLTFPNLFQLHYEEILQGFPLRGLWRSEFFKKRSSHCIGIGLW